MPYSHLDYESFTDRRLRKLFNHADTYLFDTYGMFRTLPPEDSDGGGGNFSMVLVLLCVIDGLAAEIWPGRGKVKDQKKRFKRLIRRKLVWGPEGKDKWLNKGTAVAQLYAEFRNPLVHELAADKATKSRPAGYEEPIIGKWGAIPDDLQDIAKIEALTSWNDAWPVMFETTDDQGRLRYKLIVAGLYWTVKQLAKDMVAVAKT